tara:strand:- start:885 stop:1154 length:270 start_codon:yes stop_codon:yes gene_type:complete
MIIYRDEKFRGIGVPKKTPKNKTKSHAVLIKEKGKIKLIRFGQQGVTGAGKNPRTKKEKIRKASFKKRHEKNIKKGKTSAAYWSNLVKW